jgi:predicted TIM-barrel fold metal-dependent hydrolase
MVVDVHAHFFNASDVPVGGFVEHCLGHQAPATARLFLKAAAAIAERLASLAPTAQTEIGDLRRIIEDTGSLDVATARQQVAPRLEAERDDSARRTAEAIKGSDFERLYRSIKRGQGPRAPGPALPAVSKDEIRQVVGESEQPSGPEGRSAARSASAQPEVDVADGMLGFLTYMLSARWANLQAYKAGYTDHENAFGIDRVLGSLVDFDYWLECPPLSAHDDQVLLHKLLQDLHKPYYRAVVAYNPWTDINQDGASLARVIQAFTKSGFAGVKVYPPTGFKPAGNSVNPPKTKLPRPNLQALDRVLATFFGTCADLRIPVIAHTAHSNGRDKAHDEFGGPRGWKDLLERHASNAKTPIVNFGHFGGGAGPNWTEDFANLMAEKSQVALYGDLGYWDELVCQTADAPCREARGRLEAAVAVRISDTERVMDRTMFATDWLMLSQMKRWADYPAKVCESVRTIASEPDVERVFGSNAVKCFSL